MKIGLKAGFAALALAGLAAPAQAVHFVGSYGVTAHSEGDGLLIQTTPLQPGTPAALDLVLNIVGASAARPLFTIFTEESWVNPDDMVPKAISVNFAFDSPSAITQSIGGSTQGYSFLGIVQWGELKWNAAQNPSVVSFADGSKLSIKLNDVKFGKGLFGLNGFPHISGNHDDDDDGHFHFNGCGHVVERYGATVAGLFTLNQVSAVPEPATWAYLIFGFGAVGAAMRRSARKSRPEPATA